ncbi:hypothetical protein PPROV_000375700 [Pycnococcus provasolii]|uniref:Cyclic nucleotide-binding domain-containing protein n=1 Tax=Pycnococcus provasolii TaxID=41880 RepID=A0A830HD89_9CHLO|nr:hypothetical protein PPROV_000375700 [Pycnococcus provasolii]
MNNRHHSPNQKQSFMSEAEEKRGAPSRKALKKQALTVFARAARKVEYLGNTLSTLAMLEKRGRLLAFRQKQAEANEEPTNLQFDVNLLRPFQLMPRHVYRHVANAVEFETHEKHKIITRQGDATTHWRVLVSGSATVHRKYSLATGTTAEKSGDNGVQPVQDGGTLSPRGIAIAYGTCVGELKPGDTFGAMQGVEAHAATVVAGEEGCVVAAVPKAAYATTVRHIPGTDVLSGAVEEAGGDSASNSRSTTRALVLRAFRTPPRGRSKREVEVVRAALTRHRFFAKAGETAARHIAANSARLIVLAPGAPLYLEDEAPGANADFFVVVAGAGSVHARGRALHGIVRDTANATYERTQPPDADVIAGMAEDLLPLLEEAGLRPSLGAAVTNVTEELGACITTLHAGDGIGEEALLPHAPPTRRVFSVVARETTMCIAISRDAFLEAQGLVMQARSNGGASLALPAYVGGGQPRKHGSSIDGGSAAEAALQRDPSRRSDADVQSITEATRMCSFFHHLNERVVHENVCRNAMMSQYERETSLWRQGDSVPERGGAFLVLLQGAVSQHICDPGAIVDIVSPPWPPACHGVVLAGEGIGEAALASVPGSGLRMATVIDRSANGSVFASFQKPYFTNVTVANAERRGDEAAEFIASFCEPLRVLSTEARARVARVLKRQEVSRHAELLAAGAPPSKVYVLVSGELREGTARETASAGLTSQESDASFGLSPVKDARNAARTRLGARAHSYAPAPSMPGVADHLLAAAGGSVLPSYANTRRSRALARPGEMAGWYDALNAANVTRPVWCASPCVIYAVEAGELLEALGEESAERLRLTLGGAGGAGIKSTGTSPQKSTGYGGKSKVVWVPPPSMQKQPPPLPAPPRWSGKVPRDAYDLEAHLMSSAGTGLRNVVYRRPFGTTRRGTARVQNVLTLGTPSHDPAVRMVMENTRQDGDGVVVDGGDGDGMEEVDARRVKGSEMLPPAARLSYPAPTLPSMPALPPHGKGVAHVRLPPSNDSMPTPSFGLVPSASDATLVYAVGRVTGPHTPMAPPARLSEGGLALLREVSRAPPELLGKRTKPDALSAPAALYGVKMSFELQGSRAKMTDIREAPEPPPLDLDDPVDMEVLRASVQQAIGSDSRNHKPRQ